jgi:hypothetical protein
MVDEYVTVSLLMAIKVSKKQQFMLFQKNSASELKVVILESRCNSILVHR